MSRPPSVFPVTTSRERRAFVAFPWRIYRGDPNWVPPLISDRLACLDPAKGPYYQQARIALFMARSGRRVLGTIAVFIDAGRVEHLGRTEGGFGFFEVIDEYEIARQLLDAGCEWLRSRGMTSMRGPTSFGDNDYPGVLIEGTEHPPAMLEAHTPPYYRSFLERYGMKKDHDLYAWRVTFDKVGATLHGTPSDITRVADAVRRTGSVTIRTIRFEEWDREVSTVRQLFNATLSHLPDAIPVSEAEFRNLADQMRPFLDRDLVLFAEVDGTAVGYSVLIPDTNCLLRRLNGRLFPFNWLRIRRYLREIEGVSFKMMGVLKEYRRRGIDALLTTEALAAAMRKGYRWLDASLSSELNPLVNLIAQRRGAQRYKQYRIYRMDL